MANVSPSDRNAADRKIDLEKPGLVMDALTPFRFPLVYNRVSLDIRVLFVEVYDHFAVITNSDLRG